MSHPPDTTSSPASSATKRAVVLLSGGLDSATVLAIAQRDGFECTCLSFDYGQRHRHELTAAANLARAMHIADHRTVKLDLRAFGASALTADIAVPKGRSDSDMTCGIPITYVPARNLIMLAVATACAESLGSDDIYIGVNAVDYSGYPDCRPEFVNAFAAAANLATRAGATGKHLEIHTPIIKMSKAEIIAAGTKLGVNYAMTHSCYDPISDPSGAFVALACGQCDSCQIRRKGFADAGIPDPTPYTDRP